MAGCKRAFVSFDGPQYAQWKLQPDQSLIKQQTTEPCSDKSDALLLLNEQGQTSLLCHVRTVSFCLQEILHVLIPSFHLCTTSTSTTPFPPVCIIFCGWSLESSLWPSCPTSKYHSNMVEQHNSVMWDPGTVIFVPLHYTELLIVSGGIFIPCPWFLYTHATSPSTQPKKISAFCSCFLFCPPACCCYHVCPTL